MEENNKRTTQTRAIKVLYLEGGVLHENFDDLP